MARRKIISIDEEKCNGCGLCIPNCPEGALQIIDGKARLISDLFCDGLGACIGHCPQGAISIEERDAQAYDEKQVMKSKSNAPFHGCPGSKMVQFDKELRQWPIQIMLVPVNAPYLDNSDILIAADCVAFSYADFHGDFLKGKALLIGCPKLDDIDAYRDKLSQIIKANNIKSITHIHMEVPCCFGLVNIIKSAIAEAKKDTAFKEVIVGIKGDLKSSQ